MSWVMGIIICFVVIGALAIRRAKLELWAGAVLGLGWSLCWAAPVDWHCSPV